MPREEAIAARLVVRYPADRWALLRHVRSAPGGRVDGLRIADVIAVALWPSMGPKLEVIEIKDSAGDLRRELEQPEKNAPFAAYASARWIAVAAPWKRVVTSKGAAGGHHRRPRCSPSMRTTQTSWSSIGTNPYLPRHCSTPLVGGGGSTEAPAVGVGAALG